MSSDTRYLGGKARTRRGPQAPDVQGLLDECHMRSIQLLKRNLTPGGVLAASPGARAIRRGYTAIFGRDAAVCAIGMALSGDKHLERAAATGLHTLAAHQAPNGQIAKFVDLKCRETDFWYLGCIDSTLWWLIALALLDRCSGTGRLQRQYRRHIRLAIQWLLAQEHQRFFLLQQNEASDWADIMPRSGFVLYTNALWYFVKRIYGLAHAADTRENFNGLFHPFSAGIAEYRRARLLNDYVLQRGRNRDLYLSFVNFSFFGEEGDVFGNVLAVLLGLADGRAGRRTLDALTAEQVGDPYPVRAVTRPDQAAQLVVASLHGASPAESRLAVPQRRNLADGRRILDNRPRSGRSQRAGSSATTEAGTGMPAGKLGLHGVAAREDICAQGDARAVMERRGVLDGRGRGCQRQEYLRSAAGQRSWPLSSSVGWLVRAQESDGAAQHLHARLGRPAAARASSHKNK